MYQQLKLIYRFHHSGPRRKPAVYDQSGPSSSTSSTSATSSSTSSVGLTAAHIRSAALLPPSGLVSPQPKQTSDSLIHTNPF